MGIPQISIVRFIEGNHAWIIVRWYVQNARLRVHGSPGPVCSAAAGRAKDQSLSFAVIHHLRRIQRTKTPAFYSLQRHLSDFRCEIGEITFHHPLVFKRCRLCRKRLCRPGLLAGDIRISGYRALFNGPDWFARLWIWIGLFGGEYRWKRHTAFTSCGSSTGNKSCK